MHIRFSPGNPESVIQVLRLAADVERLARRRQVGQRLQQQGGFADAGIAADQYHAALDQAAAEDAIELDQAGGDARRRARPHLGQAVHATSGGERLETARLALGGRFDQGVPGQAMRTLALPLRALAAAFGADVEGFVLGQRDVRRVAQAPL